MLALRQSFILRELMEHRSTPLPSDDRRSSRYPDIAAAVFVHSRHSFVFVRGIKLLRLIVSEILDARDSRKSPDSTRRCQPPLSLAILRTENNVVRVSRARQHRIDRRKTLSVKPADVIATCGTGLNAEFAGWGFRDVYYLAPGESVSLGVRRESALRYTHSSVGSPNPQVSIAIFAERPNPGIGQSLGAHISSNVVPTLIGIQELAQPTFGSDPEPSIR